VNILSYPTGTSSITTLNKERKSWYVVIVIVRILMSKSGFEDDEVLIKLIVGVVVKQRTSMSYKKERTSQATATNIMISSRSHGGRSHAVNKMISFFSLLTASFQEQEEEEQRNDLVFY
jgi:hypothetical protein